MKKLINIAKPFLRGVIKSFPVGNAIVEGVQNVKAGDGEKPHNWVSIITQLTICGLIVYAFVTHTITIDQVLGYLK